MGMRIGADGWIQADGRDAYYSKMPSPNCDERPAGARVRLLVIHCISLPEGIFGTGYVAQLFTNKLDLNSHKSFATLKGKHGQTLKVSAHLLIARDGGLTQFVSCNEQAWHAGASIYRGEGDCNHYSIGVELEGAVHIPFSKAQYESLISFTRAVYEAYPGVRQDTIVGHSDIAQGRKPDPGPLFDWGYYLNQVPTN